MRPIRIPGKIQELLSSSLSTEEKIARTRDAYCRLRKHAAPLVSVVIPAYNEEKNILATLHSLVLNQIKHPVEIIVVNNNSTDRTEELVKATGVSCIFEPTKGITAARNAGLRAASGTYILNADADAIYPPAWMEEMIAPLEKNMGTALTYGRFSFIPTKSAGRYSYYLYEYAADAQRYFKKYFREEAVNVYGFNSAYRREHGIAVQGYNHPKGANEDGYLALKLRDAGYGRLHYVTASRALVWTTDRRIQMEGGFVKGLSKRVKKFFFPKMVVQVRTDL